MRKAIVLRALAVLAVFAGAACGDERDNSEAAYCTEISSSLIELNAPAIVDGNGIDRTEDLYRRIKNAAPIAVAPEWQTLLNSIETASTVDPNDPQSMQLAADTARLSQRAAERIADYTVGKCGITIGTPAATTTTTPG